MDALTRMRAFVEVAEAEGFSAAARNMGRSKALLSKYVRELEDELGVLLLNRTTRQFSMTEAGERYRLAAKDILQRVAELKEDLQEEGGEPKGLLKISSSRALMDSSFGFSIGEFVSRYPEISVELNLDERFVDLVEEGFDVAIRLTKLEDSALIARKLASYGLCISASPETIKKHGMPIHPRGLSGLPCIIDTNAKGLANWPFEENGNAFTVPVEGQVSVNSPQVAKQTAIDGGGFILGPDFVVKNDLASGALVAVLPEYQISDRALYVVYPHRRHVPKKLRVFIDFLVESYKTKNE